ncbi:MAG: (d)CMP kinase [Geobacter sp.]|nr:(d)CMP kinase [Geobacter sp.]
MSHGRQKGIIIAIDGPSGAGKSTITKLLSQRLGYINIDTGAMYRTLALVVKRTGISLDDEEALQRVCIGVAIVFERSNGGYRVIANGEDVSDAIRTPEISLLTSEVSSRKVVREIMTRMQREMGKEGGVVLEGRDIGTVVFPDADVKFFLSASVEERGRRRYEELKAKGEDVSLDRTIAEVARRDEQDSNREHAPLRKADDAIELDSTVLSIEEVLAEMEKVIKSRL